MDSKITAYLTQKIRVINKTLEALLPKASTKPPTLHRAMRYSLFAGGKRIRPLLCLAACEACGGKESEALPTAAALECIHTYSLIHDDLPCMDDDDFRRGRPTAHKAFGEGIAVLAGDALLTLAFEILAQVRPTRRYPLSALLFELAHAAGSHKLIAGQVADLEGEGQKLSRSELRFIHRGKTAALITASLRSGAMVANASPAKLKALTTFGENLGLAFQIVDDILDITQTREQLGKSAGKDLDAQKLTYPAVIGFEASKHEAARLTRAALKALAAFKQKEKTTLEMLARFLLCRQS
ncbi:MAG: farnesyl-diphosphate synthase [Verrucomicrobia bacterium]|nr:MAG: farnesyl-diphosphate synthase [Verrucomicrobiota bacterium]